MAPNRDICPGDVAHICAFGVHLRDEPMYGAYALDRTARAYAPRIDTGTMALIVSTLLSPSGEYPRMWVFVLTHDVRNEMRTGWLTNTELVRIA